MQNILRITGFHNTVFFYLGSLEEKNIYRLEVDDPNDINEGIHIKKLIVHNTLLNTVEEIELLFPAESDSQQLCNGVLYYARLSHLKTLLHVSRLEFNQMQSAQVHVPLTEIIGDSTVFRIEMKGIDNRYCLVGVSTTNTYKITHMILIDFEKETYNRIDPSFGVDSLCRLVSIMTIIDIKGRRGKEFVLLITGGFHWKEKYELWIDSKKDIDLEDELLEYVILYEKEEFIRTLKSGLPLKVGNEQILEKCSLNKSITFYDSNVTKMNYTIVDFAEQRTYGIEYDIQSRKQTLFNHNKIISNPVFMNEKLYSIEYLDKERLAILDLHTNQFLVIFTSGEMILVVDKHIILTCKWLNNQQMIYLYDLREKLIEQKFLGIGISHYDGKNVTIFS